MSDPEILTPPVVEHVEAPKPPRKGAGCSLIMCEDPRTGEIVVRPPEEGCPPGFFDSVVARVATQGLRFDKRRE